MLRFVLSVASTKRFFLSPSTASFKNAKSSCLASNGTVARLESIEELEIALDILKRDGKHQAWVPLEKVSSFSLTPLSLWNKKDVEKYVRFQTDIKQKATLPFSFSDISLNYKNTRCIAVQFTINAPLKLYDVSCQKEMKVLCAKCKSKSFHEWIVIFRDSFSPNFESQIRVSFGLIGIVLY